MKNFVFFVILLCFTFTINVNAQVSIGEVWGCHTYVDTSNDIQLTGTLSDAPIDMPPKIVNVFVHVVRTSSGTGGLTTDQVENWISHLHNDYINHGIIIHVIGLSYVNNSTFYNGITDQSYASLISTDTHSNAIDLYLLSPNDTYSRASGIPGVALSIGGSYVGSSVLSHELGHCLGLYHTHSGRGCNDNANCAENINGTNCSSCGDLVCDTPADPCLSGNVNTTCGYIGGNGFNPDVHNIMSYAPPLCLSLFSQGQIERMHYITSTALVLDTRVTVLSLSGPATLCATPTTYTLSAGSASSWSVTPTSAFSLTSTYTASAVVKPLHLSGQAGTLTATLYS
jgi:hypothetical protein